MCESKKSKDSYPFNAALLKAIEELIEKNPYNDPEIKDHWKQELAKADDRYKINKLANEIATQWEEPPKLRNCLRFLIEANAKVNKLEIEMLQMLATVKRKQKEFDEYQGKYFGKSWQEVLIAEGLRGGEEWIEELIEKNPYKDSYPFIADLLKYKREEN